MRPLIRTPNSSDRPRLLDPKPARGPFSAARRLFFAAFLLAVIPSITAQQPISLADADLRAQTLFLQSGGTGMVLVAVRNHELLIKGYGEASPGSGKSPDANSLVRLCSISKVFTADLLLRLVADGKVNLTDPLQRYAPPGIQIPTGDNAAPITLRDLATHTAGLPREVSAYPAKTPHFTFPDYKFRWTWLPKQKLITTPGNAALYSNIGFDLLGDALASAAGKPFPTLLHERLLQPLGMWDTTLFPNNQQCARLLQSFRNEGPCTPTEASGPSGGLYSTPTDMARLLQYLLQIPGAPAPSPNELTVQLKPQDLKSVQGLSHAGEPTGIGLAWLQLGVPDSPSTVIEKTGGGGGFTTYIALNPKRQTGIFIALTDGKGDSTIDPFEESNHLLAALAGVPAFPPWIRKHHPPQKHQKHHAPTRRTAHTSAPH